MKVTLEYSTHMTLNVHTLGMIATIDFGASTLENALDYVQSIFDDDTMFHGDTVGCVHITDSNTGELIAMCERESTNDNDYDAVDDYCDYEIGFDPYLGCYSEDC